MGNKIVLLSFEEKYGKILKVVEYLGKWCR